MVSSMLLGAFAYLMPALRAPPKDELSDRAIDAEATNQLRSQ